MGLVHVLMPTPHVFWCTSTCSSVWSTQQQHTLATCAQLSTVSRSIRSGPLQTSRAEAKPGPAHLLLHPMQAQGNKKSSDEIVQWISTHTGAFFGLKGQVQALDALARKVRFSRGVLCNA